jgi:hypothetical protein
MAEAPATAQHSQGEMTVAGVPTASAEAHSQSVAAAPAGGAASAAPAEEKWRFSLAPYLWVPAISGTVGVGERKIDVDVSQRDAFDLLSDLDAAFSLHAEASYGKVSLFLDAMYASFESDETAPVVGPVRVDVAQGLFEVGVAYRVLDLPLDHGGATRLFIEPLVGVRVLHVDTEITLFDLGLEPDGSQTWVNVMGGVRGRLSFFDNKVGVFGRGDFGYGTSSSTSWNAIGGVDVALASWCSLIGGYRWLGIDYSKDQAVGEFVFDVVQEGPFMAIEFRF